MRRTPDEEALRWLRQSEADLDAAKYNFEGNIYYLVCFLAQQIAEKALKALIYSQGEEIVIGHSVAMLAERVRNYGIAIDNLADEISVLDGYYIPTRYPNGLPDGIPAQVYNKKSAEDALQLAEKTVGFAKKLLLSNS
ncbi:MAG: HEPN domain-containing protein [Ignavibacteria bacterium]|nr:HEPN domain-containing protein [Ignavibacteria bacterium]